MTYSRSTTRRSQPLLALTVLLLLFTSSVAALSWPEFLPAIDSLVVRADDTTTESTTATATETSKATTTTGTAKTTATTDTDSESATDSDASTATDSTASGSKSGSTTGTKTTGTTTGKTTTKSSTKTTSSSISIDPADPAGGVSLLTPSAAETTYYKIGDYVTFVWNYTSLSVTPTAVDVFATCTANAALYTLAVNQTVGNGTDAVTWDTGGYQATATVPLLTETYTLIIYDAASSISATAAAGYLSVYDTYSFGMYTPQAYVPLSEYHCATCSAALSSMDNNALSFMLAMCAVTVFSFTWFVTGLDVVF